MASITRTVKGIRLGVVALGAFSLGAHGEVSEAVEHELHGARARGIVFDLRANGGGLVEEARLVASIFLPQGATVVTTRGRTQPTQTLTAAGGAIPGSVPVVVLVDRGTASAAESVTAAPGYPGRGGRTHVPARGSSGGQPLQQEGAGHQGNYFANGRNLGGGGVREGGDHPGSQLRVGGWPARPVVALDTLAAGRSSECQSRPVVAVLEGRFWTAEPLFPERDTGDGAALSPPAPAGARITLGRACGTPGGRPGRGPGAPGGASGQGAGAGGAGDRAPTSRDTSGAMLDRGLARVVRDGGGPQGRRVREAEDWEGRPGAARPDLRALRAFTSSRLGARAATRSRRSGLDRIPPTPGCGSGCTSRT
jgi:hypothetical protein